MNQPKPYTPASQRLMQERPHVLYGIGQRQRETGRYAMMYGPTSLQTCLEQPAIDGATIIRFNLDHTDEPIWTWHQGQWHPLPDVNHDDYATLCEPETPPQLSATDLHNLAYFSIEKGDPTYWSGWARKEHLVRTQLPKFYAAWLARKAAHDVFIKQAYSLLPLP